MATESWTWLDIRNAYSELDGTCPISEYNPTKLYQWLTKSLLAFKRFILELFSACPGDWFPWCCLGHLAPADQWRPVYKKNPGFYVYIGCKLHPDFPFITCPAVLCNNQGLTPPFVSFGLISFSPSPPAQPGGKTTNTDLKPALAGTVG